MEYLFMFTFSIFILGLVIIAYKGITHKHLK